MKKKTKVLLGAAAIVVLYAGCAGSKKENPAMVQQAVSRTDEKQERETSQSEKKPEESKPVQPVQEEKKEPAASQEQTLQPEPAVQDSGIRPEFKEAVDTYVTFYEEYAEFMQRYAANPSDMVYWVH